MHDTVRREMRSMYQRFGGSLTASGHVNGNFPYRMAIEEMRGACAIQIIDRWSDRLFST
jgi:hypothetical protein